MNQRFARESHLFNAACFFQQPHGIVEIGERTVDRLEALRPRRKGNERSGHGNFVSRLGAGNSHIRGKILAAEEQGDRTSVGAGQFGSSGDTARAFQHQYQFHTVRLHAHFAFPLQQSIVNFGDFGGIVAFRQDDAQHAGTHGGLQVVIEKWGAETIYANEDLRGRMPGTFQFVRQQGARFRLFIRSDRILEVVDYGVGT